jgi:hypothetical protein
MVSAYRPPSLSADRWLVEVVQSGPARLDNYPAAELDLCQLSVTVTWRGQGTGQLTVPRAASGYDLVVEKNWIILTDLLSNFRWYGVILEVDQTEEATQPEQKVCQLADFRWYVYRRIIVPGGYSQGQQVTSPVNGGGYAPVVGAPQPQVTTPTANAVNLSGSTEGLVKQFVSDQCLSRNAMGDITLNLVPAQARGSTQYVQVTGEPLSQIIPQLLALDDFGDTAVLLSDYSVLYDIAIGIDRTVGVAPGNGYDPQIFTVDADNVSQIGYKRGATGHVNAVLVLGKAAAATAPAGGGNVSQPARPQLWVEDSLSIQKYGRIEAVVDAGDADGLTAMTTAGQFYLAQHPEASTMRFTPRETAAERFGISWNVGDLVTVERTDWGVTQNLRIQQITLEIGSPDLKVDALPETVNFLSNGAASALPTNIAGRIDPGRGASAPEFWLDLVVGPAAPVWSSRALPPGLTRH